MTSFFFREEMHQRLLRRGMEEGAWLGGGYFDGFFFMVG